MLGCSESLTPEDGCVGWYQGFYILRTADSLYLRVELDMTWALPDSAIIVTPLRNVRPDRIFERVDPPGLAVVAAVDDIVSGMFLLRAFYGGSVQTYEEHLSLRNDVLNYNFESVRPRAGETGMSLTPTIRWDRLYDTQARVRVYADSLRELGVFSSTGIDDADSVRIPTGVLSAGTLYFWTLEVYDWESFVPDCPAGYYYMDFFDNGVFYVGWFTTVGGKHDP
jgi:hypothetical protein